MIKIKIKKGDKVKILAGKDKGKEGKVLQVFLNRGRISIEGINLHVKHLRPKKQNEKGQRIQFPAPLAVSNVMLMCPKCNQPTRVGMKFLENKKRQRACKKCGEVI